MFRRECKIARMLSLVLLLSPATLIHAQDFVNGSFEVGGGTFTGWTTAGNAVVNTSSFGVSPVQGTFQAFNSTGNGSITASSLETFIGASAGTLTTLASSNDPTTTAIQGSAIKQTVTATAGQFISFSWNFLTNENLPDAFNNDFAFVSINGTVTRLANTFSSGFSPAPGATGFSDHTGYGLFSFLVPSNGNYTVSVGVVDVGDNFVTSGLLTDNFTVAVPEPVTVVLAGSVIGLAYWKHRLRKKKATVRQSMWSLFKAS